MTSLLLKYLCREPKVEVNCEDQLENKNPLHRVQLDFPFAKFQDASIVDFGCGWGMQAMAFAKIGASKVLALEIGAEKRNFLEKLAKEQRLDHLIQVKECLSDSDHNQFDFVVSLDAMEHYGDPKKIMNQFSKLLKPGGILLLSFGPPWYAPYGAHLQFMSSLPWIHLFFSESALMNARAKYRNDGARKFREVEGGLNQISVRKFERLLRHHGFKVKYKKYYAVKGLTILTKVPFLREFFINQISLVAIKK